MSEFLDVAKFVGLTHHWTRSDVEGSEQRDLLKEIDSLRYVIRLRLNPDDEPDRGIARRIREIPDLTDESEREELYAALDALTDQTQRLLKAEWEKVKQESKRGDLHD